MAHRRELVQQAASHCERAYPAKSIEVELGPSHASGLADITVASVQSLLSGDRLSRYDPDNFKLVLVDEAHHIVAPGYLKMLEHFRLELKRKDSPALVGVSATMSRLDGIRIGAAIDHIVYHKDYVAMIEEKWLVDIIFTTVKSKANLSSIKSSSGGDFNVDQLSRAVNTPDNNQIAFNAWRSQAGQRESTLVFCVDTRHVRDLTKVFRDAGVDAQYITSLTNTRERASTLADFRNRQFPVLINCGIFTEGTDIPNIDCILLARPTKSRNLLVQMIGRGTRLFPGKENCHVIDMVSALQTGVVTVPTLYGLDPFEIVTRASPEQLQTLKARLEEEKAQSLETGLNESVDVSDRQLTMTHYSSIHDLIADTSGERHIRSMSPNAWVQVGERKYVLSVGSGVMTIEFDPEKSLFQVLHKRALPKLGPQPDVPNHEHSQASSHGPPRSTAPFTRPRVVASSPTLPLIVAAADTFASKNFPRQLIIWSAPWRSQPASSSQVEFLNRFRGKSCGSGEDEDDGLRPAVTASQITKGRAADMLTKWKHGAKGQFERMQKTKRREERREEKEDFFRERNLPVQVGPLAR